MAAYAPSCMIDPPAKFPSVMTSAQNQTQCAPPAAVASSELATSAAADGPQQFIYAKLEAGDQAPWVSQRTNDRDTFHLSSAGGRYLVLGFLGSAEDSSGQAAAEALWSARHRFRAEHAVFFGVSADPKDEAKERLRGEGGAFRWFWDFDGSLCRSYGALPRSGPGPFRRFWLVLGPSLRVVLRLPFTGHDGGIADLLAQLDTLPSPAKYAGFEVFAPVLVLPDIFEADLCSRLIRAYDLAGGTFSGTMQVKNGMTVPRLDPEIKVRRDHTLDSPELIEKTKWAVTRRILPEIQKIHQFIATRMERYLVGCYAAEDGGHFRPHRDNTTPGTAHRRYAVSINLNDDFEGGRVYFPEYGMRGYKAPAGGAVVFSCSLLHAVSPVTHGQRYAFLPFLYDEAAALIREKNMHTIQALTA